MTAHPLGHLIKELLHYIHAKTIMTSVISEKTGAADLLVILSYNGNRRLYWRTQREATLTNVTGTREGFDSCCSKDKICTFCHTTVTLMSTAICSRWPANASEDNVLLHFWKSHFYITQCSEIYKMLPFRRVISIPVRKMYQNPDPIVC